jgi:hypothetical protein
MTAEITGIETRDPERDAAVAADGVGNWNVHSSPNENCDVHSSAGNFDAHSIDALYASTGIPTLETSRQFQAAYDYFNRELFQNKLPNCLITLQRQRSSYGYFSAERFGRNDGQRTDEIAINPQHLQPRSIEQTLSTLVHEMKHLEQHHFGKPGRGRYHNKEWADMMEAIGLIPSDTGRPGGKRTGDRVSDYIKDGGAFALATARLLATGFEITWREVAPELVGAGGRGSEEDGGGSLSGKRTKFACPRDGCQNAWAKPTASLMCAIHREKMLPAG